MNQFGEQEAKILAYTLAVKKLEAQIVTFQKHQLSLNEQLTFQANEIYAKDEKLKRYRRIVMKAVKKGKIEENNALAAKRLNDEFEMSEQQRKRAAEVQQQAQYYTKEDWDLIRARMEASTELRKSVFGTDIDAEDYANKMVELVEKRRREIREQKLKAKKNKPMTQAEQRNYMMNYVRSQSHGWTIPQLKKLSFEELKVQFERTIRSIENFIPVDSGKEKERLKRSGETLHGAEKKKQKVLDVEDIPIPESAKFVKEEEIEVKQPVLKMSRRKSKARKGIGLHTSTEPESGEVDITSSKIVKWKILRHGGKGYCHLIRANQRDSVFVNFRAMLHNISRDDLVDLYKIVLQKTTAYGPEENLERAFAENLRIMFDPPQSEDIVSYPLSEEVCRMVVKKKLFTQNTEVKKKLLLQRSNRDDSSVPVSKRCCKEQGAASNSRKSNVVVPNILKDKVYNNFQKLKDEERCLLPTTLLLIKYGVQMIMRFNEIHKFSDGTLQQIDEALDYRVKEFRINRTNPGMNARFWTKKDVDRSKVFMFAIQKRLKTRRIFRNLESFVGGRIREGDYRLLQRTE
ncbi:hypothetical protein Tco_0677104 [Tanacetum coccineum]